MLSTSSSLNREDTNYNQATISLNRVLCSPKSSPPPSPSPFSYPAASHHLHNQTLKTMEEVWKDINLASLHDHSSRSREPLSSSVSASANYPNSNNPHFILQDFLARPFTKDPPPNYRVSNTNTNTTSTTTTTTMTSTPFASPVLPPPATILSLNSGPVFDFFDNSDPMIGSNSRLQTSPISNLSAFDCPFDALASSPAGLASFSKKRVQESDTPCGDRRHKRMIKNRESAARSRARKQAYTNELELEVAQLLEENTRLRRQQEQLRIAAAGAQLPKKRTLQRTSTAPF